MVGGWGVGSNLDKIQKNSSFSSEYLPLGIYFKKLGFQKCHLIPKIFSLNIAIEALFVTLYPVKASK